jgi:hypothetical protein
MRTLINSLFNEPKRILYTLFLVFSHIESIENEAFFFHDTIRCYRKHVVWTKLG